MVVNRLLFPTLIEGGEKYLDKGRIRSFTDIETFEKEYDADGNFIPLEERITEEQNVFHDSGIESDFTDGQKLMLRMGLSQLSDQQREVMKASYFDGMAQNEIAQTMGITQQAVNKHYKAAMKKLRKICLDK